jgi:hypothetical protein
MGIVNLYQQADEPSAETPAGTVWFRDDGTSAVKKIDLTWNELGSWQEENWGKLLVSGGTMLGPILGAHGLAELDSPAFTGTPTIEGDEIATKPWTIEQLDALQLEIQNFINGAFGGSGNTITIGNNLAMIKGTAAHGDTCALPAYADGDTAALADVWVALPSLESMLVHDGEEANDVTWDIDIDANLLVTCQAAESHWGTQEGRIHYLVICKR